MNLKGPIGYEYCSGRLPTLECTLYEMISLMLDGLIIGLCKKAPFADF